MRILITNDDGIHAPGIAHLVRWAGKLGEVVVAAPAVEQSAKSHAIQIHNDFRAEKVDCHGAVRAYKVDSTPADCVRFAVLGMEEKVDLVLSGINRGLNVGSDILYSGTVAAVFEAGVLGIPAIAVSTQPESFDGAVGALDQILDFFRRHRLMEKGSLYNVNIPLAPKGIRITRQGGPYYSDRFLPREDNMYHPDGYSVYAPSNEEFDTDTVLTHSCISIMPLQVSRANTEVWNALRHISE